MHSSILLCMLEYAGVAVRLLHEGRVQGIQDCEAPQAGLQTQRASGPCLALCREGECRLVCWSVFGAAQRSLLSLVLAHPGWCMPVWLRHWCSSRPTRLQSCASCVGRATSVKAPPYSLAYIQSGCLPALWVCSFVGVPIWS